MMPRVLVFAVVAALAVVIIGSAAPSPKTWAGADYQDLDAKARVTWHPLRGAWTIDTLELDAEPSKWLNLEGAFRNLLSLTSGSEDVAFTLLEKAGQPRATLVEKTGRGGLFGSERTIGVTFREIPPGHYIVHVKVLSESGSVLAERSQDIRIVEAP